MTTIINASSTNGLVQTADGSGVLKVQSNGVTTNALAWVNFNGSTAAIRASYNVSSITRNALGTYTVALSTALSDANYAVFCGTSAADANNDNGWMGIKFGTTPTTSSFQLITDGRITGEYDPAYSYVSVFGN